jgi:hypothetical protein
MRLWWKIKNSWLTPGLITLALTGAAYSCRPGGPPLAPPAPTYAREDALTDRDTQRPIPEKPFDWQKKPKGKPPRCGPKEFLINGACYRRAHPDDYSPPCEKPTVEHKGTCYYFVEVAPPQPTSVEP